MLKIKGQFMHSVQYFTYWVLIVLFVGELDREEGGEDSEHKQEVPTASGIQIKLYTVHPKYEANL